MDKLVLVTLACLVCVIPGEGYFAIEGFETFTRIFGAVAFLLGIVTVLLTFTVRPLHRAFAPLILFVIWSFMGLLWSLGRESTQTNSQTFLLLLMFVWLIWQYADSLLRQQWLMRAFMLGTAVAMIDMFISRLRGVDPFTGEKLYRYTGMMADANGMAIFLVTAINFAFYLATRPGQKGLRVWKLAYWGFLMAAAVGVFLTGSRAGVLALVASVGVTSLALLRVGWKPAVIFTLCLGAAVYIIVHVVPENLLSRVQEGMETGTAQARFTLWEQSLQAWKENPILGIGSGATGDIGAGVSHNTFISVLTENGLIGLAIYLLFWAFLAAAILSLQKAEKILWITMLVSYVPHLLSISAEYEKVVWLIFGLILAQTISVTNVKVRRGAGRLAVQRLRPNAA